MPSLVSQQTTMTTPLLAEIWKRIIPYLESNGLGFRSISKTLRAVYHDLPLSPFDDQFACALLCVGGRLETLLDGGKSRYSPGMCVLTAVDYLCAFPPHGTEIIDRTIYAVRLSEGFSSLQHNAFGLLLKA